MAKEIKSIDVSNSQEEAYIQIYQSFGWELKSSQRVFNRDSRLTSEGDSLYTETTTTDFTKLVFEREKKIPNYGELVELESEFWELSDVEKPEMAKPVGTVKEWGKRTSPKLRTEKEVSMKKTILNIATFGITFAIIIIFAFIATPYQTTDIPTYDALVAKGGTTAFVYLVVITAIRLIFLNEKVLEFISLSMALNSPDSKYGKRLKTIYETAIEEAECYERCRARMRELLSEAENLL